jgi:hypothetical protein
MRNKKEKLTKKTNNKQDNRKAMPGQVEGVHCGFPGGAGQDMETL